jgi:hypothetical protein
MWAMVGCFVIVRIEQSLCKASFATPFTFTEGNPMNRPRNPMTPHLAAAVALSAALFAASQSGAQITAPNTGTLGKTPPALGVIVKCPATITVAATNAPSPWYPSANQMSISSALLSQQAPTTQQMICRYVAGALIWEIGRPIAPEFKACTPTGTQFICTKP